MPGREEDAYGSRPSVKPTDGERDEGGFELGGVEDEGRDAFERVQGDLGRVCIVPVELLRLAVFGSGLDQEVEDVGGGRSSRFLDSPPLDGIG